MTASDRRQEVLPADPALLADRIHHLHLGGERVLIGIVGAPGSGKSTLAAAVRDAVAGGSPPLAAALVPMDGYHLAQRVLEDAGLAAIKGAPATFDAAGYVALLERLRDQRPDGAEVVYAPEFRRALEEPIAGAVPVTGEVPVILTEGNYLLGHESPWCRVQALLTQTWYLDVPEELRLERLVSRHIAFGRSPAEAGERATTGSDGRNADYVRSTRSRANVLLRPV